MVSHLPIVLFISILTAFRLAYTGWVDLVADEAHFWIWSQQMNPLNPGHFGSYHPPMVAYFIALTGFLGDSERVIRLSSVISGSIVTGIVYYLAYAIFKSRSTGFFAAILLNLAPIFAIGSLLITTDTPFIFFWTVMLFLGYKIINNDRPLYWYVLGAVFGLALLSKFTAALFPAAFFLFLLFSSRDRHKLTKKEPYLAFLLAMIVFSPMIFWSFAEEISAFQFHLSRAFSTKTYSPVMRFAEFWGGQIGLLGGPIFFFIIASSIGAGFIGFREKRNDYMYLFFMSAPLILFFFLNSFRSRMEANWPAAAYIAAVISTPGFVHYAVKRLSQKTGAWARYGYVFSLVISAALIVYAHAYIINPSLPMPENVTINKRFYGWSDLGKKAGEKLESMRPDSFILTDWYHSASLVHYYAKSRPPAYLISESERFRFFSPNSGLIGKDALYVSEPERLRLAEVEALFETVEPAGSLVIELNGEFIQEFHFFKCYNYRGIKIRL